MHMILHLSEMPKQAMVDFYDVLLETGQIRLANLVKPAIELSSHASRSYNESRYESRSASRSPTTSRADLRLATAAASKLPTTFRMFDYKNPWFPNPTVPEDIPLTNEQVKLLDTAVPYFKDNISSSKMYIQLLAMNVIPKEEATKEFVLMKRKDQIKILVDSVTTGYKFILFYRALIAVDNAELALLLKPGVPPNERF